MCCLPFSIKFHPTRKADLGGIQSGPKMCSQYNHSPMWLCRDQ